MNYDDELERARVKRSRKRENNTGAAKPTKAVRPERPASGINEAANLNAEAGSRAARNRAATSARRKKKKKSGMGWKILLGVVIGILILALAAAAGLYGYFNKQLEDSQSKLEFKQEVVINDNISAEVREKMEKGFWTVAVFGVDSRDNSLGKGNQSDVIMIANLNRNTGEIKLVSVFRDTYLNINDKNTYNKINAAYASGGPEAAVKAINKNLDLNITHYATFNWKAVATVINILGGVEIDISPAEFHYINAFITETVKGTGIGSTQLKSAGVHNLDGVQAVAYGRLRLMDSDYARTERQRIVISKAFEKVKTAKLSTLNDVVGHVFEMSATNIGFEDLAGLVKDVAKYHMGETSGFPAARGEARIKIGSDRLSCVIPQTLESNVISLHNFLYGDENYQPSKTVRDISAKIAEISGLATEAEEIGHVAVDKGYVPKPTTAAAEETAAEDTDDNRESTLESDTDGSASESSSADAESESGESATTEESGSASETEESAEGMRPGSITGPGSMTGPGGMIPSDPTSESPRVPGSNGYGPGSDVIPEATTGATGPIRPGSGTSVEVVRPGVVKPTVEETLPAKPGSASAPTGPSSSLNPSGATEAAKPGTAVKPGTTTVPGGTTAPGSSASPTGGSASSVPSSPADMTIPSGTISGPATQATTGAAPGM